MKKEDDKVASFFSRGVKKNSHNTKNTKEEKTNQKKTFSGKINKNTNDDLTKIKGIGPVIAKVLNKYGIISFSDLAEIGINDLEKILEQTRGNHNVSQWVNEANSLAGKIEKKKRKLGGSETKDISEKKNQKIEKNYGFKNGIKNRKGKFTNSVVGNKKDKVNNKKRIDSPVRVVEMLKENTIKENTVKESNKKTEELEKKSILTKIINFLLLGLFFGSILFFTNQSFQGISFEKVIWFEIISIAGGVLFFLGLLSKQNIKIKKTPFDKILVLFILLYGVTSWLSVDKWHSLVGFFNDPSRGLIFALSSIIIFYLIVNNFTLQTAKKAFGIITFGIILLSAYTLIASLGIIPVNIQMLIPFNLVGSLRDLSTILIAGVPILAGGFFGLNKWKNRKTAIIIQAVLVTSLFTILLNLMILKISVPWVALLGGVIIFVFLSARKQNNKIGGIFSKSVMFIILGLFMLLAVWARSNYYTLIPNFSKIALPIEVRSSLPVSIGIVQNSITSDWKQQLLGSGPATFGYDFAKLSPKGVVSPSPTVKYLYQGKGLLLEAIPTIGIIGGVLILILGIILIVQLLKNISISEENNIYINSLFVAVVILLMAMVSGQVGGGLLIFAGLLISLAIFFILKNNKSYYNINLKKAIIKQFIVKLIIIFCLIVFIGTGIYITRYYMEDIQFKKITTAKDEDSQNKELAKFLQYNSREGIYYTKIGQIFLVSLEKKIEDKEELSNEDIQEIKNNIIRYVVKGSALNPNDVKSKKFLAIVYETIGGSDLQNARKLYEEIIKLDPNSIQDYIKLGDSYLLEAKKSDDNNKLDKALEWYKKGLSIQPRAGIIYDRIATVYYKKGDLDKAIQALEMAIKMSPNNMSYQFTLGVLYQLKGDKNDIAVAEKIFTILLKQSPNNIDILAQLGLLYEQTGKIDEAKKQYQKIISTTEGKEELKKIKEAFEKFISNLDEGKLNFKKSKTSKSVDKKIDEIQQNNREDKNETNNTNDNINDKEEISQQENTETKEKVIITVGAEGPINVRSAGSLKGKKLTKITKTGEFEKIGESGKWIQIIIPTKDDKEEIKGWVHSKFVTE